MWETDFQNKGDMTMNEFKKFHPFINLIYFVFAIGFGCVFMHPVSLGISLFCSISYMFVAKGRKALGSFRIILPFVALTALINPLFNHQGVTILGYFPWGNPLTFESVFYGICASFMVIGVMCFFSGFNVVMTTDKFVYLFGKILPKFSLILSMVIRFVPQFARKIKEVANTQKTLGKGLDDKRLFIRMKNAVSIMGIMFGWAFENSMDTADSMRSRGYGLKGRTSFSLYRMDKRDICTLVYILLLGLYIIISGVYGGMEMRFFPSLVWNKMGYFEISVFVSYFMLLITPVLVEIVEVIRWNVTKSEN